MSEMAFITGPSGANACNLLPPQTTCPDAFLLVGRAPMVRLSGMDYVTRFYGAIFMTNASEVLNCVPV